MNGYKIHHGMPLDPRLAVVAKRAGLRRGEVLALWVALMDYASQNKPRGSLQGIDPEKLGVMLEFDTDDVARALKAFQAKNLISANELLNDWVESQALSSTARVREHRARRRQDILDRLEEEEPRQKMDQEMLSRHKKRGKIMTEDMNPRR
jgi:hypothetical protein